MYKEVHIKRVSHSTAQTAKFLEVTSEHKTYSSSHMNFVGIRGTMNAKSDLTEKFPGYFK